MSESNIGLPRSSSLSQSEGNVLSAGVLRVPAQSTYLGLIGIAVKWFAKRVGLGEEACHELETAVDEACTNVILYAFPEGASGDMVIVCSPVDTGLAVTIQDKGTRFDPKDGMEIGRRKRERDPASGGMGLFLIQQLSDRIDYQWNEENGNQLTLFKHV